MHMWFFGGQSPWVFSLFPSQLVGEDCRPALWWHHLLSDKGPFSEAGQTFQTELLPCPSPGVPPTPAAAIFNNTENTEPGWMSHYCEWPAELRSPLTKRPWNARIKTLLYFPVLRGTLCISRGNACVFFFLLGSIKHPSIWVRLKVLS